MDIIKYVGIDYNFKYSTEELNNILSKFNNLNVGDYCFTARCVHFLSVQNISTIIAFINMFEDVNETEAPVMSSYYYSLAGTIVRMIWISKFKKTYVYKMMDHLLKKNMNVSAICTNVGSNNNYRGCSLFDHIHYVVSEKNHNIIIYVATNFNTIRNVRKIINNYDIILFDITDDLPFIELILLISKSKHKIVPKFIITHKILYYYLLDRNIMYKLNKDENNNT